ncbi:hypothetical protein Tco_0318827 [Tanacetum coccineum]
MIRVSHETEIPLDIYARAARGTGLLEAPGGPCPLVQGYLGLITHGIQLFRFRCQRSTRIRFWSQRLLELMDLDDAEVQRVLFWSTLDLERNQIGTRGNFKGLWRILQLCLVSFCLSRRAYGATLGPQVCISELHLIVILEFFIRDTAALKYDYALNFLAPPKQNTPRLNKISTRFLKGGMISSTLFT